MNIAVKIALSAIFTGLWKDAISGENSNERYIYSSREE